MRVLTRSQSWTNTGLDYQIGITHTFSTPSELGVGRIQKILRKVETSKLPGSQFYAFLNVMTDFLLPSLVPVSVLPRCECEEACLFYLLAYAFAFSCVCLKKFQGYSSKHRS